MSGIPSSSGTIQPNGRNPAITHDCPQCPSPHARPRGSRALWLLAQLPSELHSKVVERMIVPQRPCLEHIFGSCLDTWGCPNGSHMDVQDLRMVIVPCPRLTSLSTFFYDEGHKMFFANHTFVFENRCVKLDPRMRAAIDEEEREVIRQEYRDCHATRLLDFIDRPDWVGTGSKSFQTDGRNRLFGDVDSYRYSIQHLVLTAALPGDATRYRRDWDWPLKVDWEKLPRLKTLVLDLRYYSFSPRIRHRVTQSDYDLAIEDGARRMKCLKLKRLVICGACSGPFHGVQRHQGRMKSLFETAVDVDGALEFRDLAIRGDW